jgi:hypothetical protein
MTFKQMWLSLLLCIVVVVTILPSKAFAEGTAGVTEVRTLEELINAVSTNGSGDIILKDNIFGSMLQLNVERDVTIDLNGYTLSITTSDNHNAVKHLNNATLIIMDSSSSSTGIFDAKYTTDISNPGAGAGINITDGTLIINSGMVSTYGSMFASGIGGSVGASGGYLIVNGGEVNTNYIGAGPFNYNYNGNIEINGGIIKVIGKITGHQVKINGGIVNSSICDNVEINGGIINAGYFDGEFEINGGTINVGKIKFFNGDFGEITINGGTFIANNVEVSAVINGGSVKVSNFSINPVNNHGDELYCVELTIPGQNNQPVTAVIIDGVEGADIPETAQGVYGIKDISTDGSGKLYLYLPFTDDDKLLIITINDTEYETSYQRTNDPANNNQTMEAVVSSISIANEPYDVNYIEGGALDLTGIVVRLHKSDGSSENVALADFSAKGITTSPANGEQLSLSDNTVTVTYAKNSKSYSLTIPISVIPRDAVISPTSISYDLNSPNDITTYITWNANNNVTGLEYNSVSLPVDAYTVSGIVLTIKSSYIEGLGISEGDELSFCIYFDIGNVFYGVPEDLCVET